MKHVHIYTPEGMQTGVLGYILEQSTSFYSNNFQFNQQVFDAFMESSAKSVDPWDNHNLSHEHWSHSYIEATETCDDNFVWLNNFVHSFEARSVFGMSYGGYCKSTAWQNPILQHVGTQYNEDMFRIWFECYMTRKLNNRLVTESLRTHIHDHHQDDPEYKERVMQGYGSVALQMDTVEFWQLQACYHHQHNSLPDLDYKDTFRDYLMKQSMEDFDFNVHNDVYYVDPLNINVYNICTDLNIEHTDAMQQSVDNWNLYTSKVLNEL